MLVVVFVLLVSNFSVSALPQYGYWKIINFIPEKGQPKCFDEENRLKTSWDFEDYEEYQEFKNKLTATTECVNYTCEDCEYYDENPDLCNNFGKY